jgi:type IV fimbrial biogenesis protein FimT
MSKSSAGRGFTLIELMVTLGIASLLILLAAPSFQDMILVQRLRGVNAQLVTDLQLARSEAVARGINVRFNLGSDATQSCSTIYTAVLNNIRCNCLSGAGTACPQTGGSTTDGYVEIKTVSVPSSGSVALTWPSTQSSTFMFDHVTGGLVSNPTDGVLRPLPRVVIDSRVDDDRRLTNEVIQSGRPHVCSPNVAKMQGVACPVPTP